VFLSNGLLQKVSNISLFKNFRRLEVVAMLVSFPTNVHKLRSDEDIPSYGRFIEKGAKTSKTRKLTS